MVSFYLFEKSLLEMDFHVSTWDTIPFPFVFYILLLLKKIRISLKRHHYKWKLPPLGMGIN